MESQGALCVFSQGRNLEPFERICTDNSGPQRRSIVVVVMFWLMLRYAKKIRGAASVVQKIDENFWLDTVL